MPKTFGLMLAGVLAFWDAATTVMGSVYIFGNNNFGILIGIVAALGVFLVIYYIGYAAIKESDFRIIGIIALVFCVGLDIGTSIYGNIYVAEQSRVQLQPEVWAFAIAISLLMAASPALMRIAKDDPD